MSPVRPKKKEMNEMSYMNRTGIALALVLLGTAPTLACDAYDEVVAAVNAQDRATVSRLYGEMRRDAECGQDLRNWAGIYLAREYYRDSTDPALSIDTRSLALQNSLMLERHWRTLSALGEVEWEREDYAAAAEYLGQALTEIAEGNQNHEVTTEEILQVRTLYTDALALSGTQMASAQSELFRPNYRGFEVEETPLPITFEYDSVAFDEQGQFYADALLEHVLAYDPPRIELDGHTDPQGSDDYNLSLSVRRAEALRQFLERGGYEGEVVVRGMGESQVPVPPEGVAEGSDEHYRIARRVTFRTS